MFNFFKKKSKADGIEVLSVATGQLMPITDVKDDVFSTKMLGDGYAIKPTDGHIYAPVSGEITTVFPTQHAIGIKTADGLEILLHLGLDTVELKGAPFMSKVAKGDQVKAGDLLTIMDTKQVTDAGYDDSVIVVYTNMDKIKELSAVKTDNVEHGKTVQKLKLN